MLVPTCRGFFGGDLSKAKSFGAIAPLVAYYRLPWVLATDFMMRRRQSEHVRR